VALIILAPNSMTIDDGVTPIPSARTDRLRIPRGYTLPRVKHKGC
jgi:hypothetical protein